MHHQPKYSNKKKPLCSSITTSSIHVVSTSTSDQLFPSEQYTITSQDHPSTSHYPNFFNQGVIPYPIPLNSRPVFQEAPIPIDHLLSNQLSSLTNFILHNEIHSPNVVVSSSYQDAISPSCQISTSDITSVPNETYPCNEPSSSNDVIASDYYSNLITVKKEEEDFSPLEVISSNYCHNLKSIKMEEEEYDFLAHMEESDTAIGNTEQVHAGVINTTENMDKSETLSDIYHTDIFDMGDDIYDSGENFNEVTEESDIPMLSMDDLHNIRSYLAPKEMQSLSYTCKAMVNTLTMEQVVYSVSLSGGYSKRTLDNIYQGCLNKSIWTMSPIALLDACLLRKCGSCKSGKINFLRGQHVLPICWACLTGTKICGNVRKTSELFLHHPVECNGVLGHERVSCRTIGWRNARSHRTSQIADATRNGDFFVWHAPDEDDVEEEIDRSGNVPRVLCIRDRDNMFMRKTWRDTSGNPVGSLLTFQEVINLCNLSKGLTRNEIIEKVDEYLTEKKAPTQNDAFYQDLIMIYDSLREKAVEREENRLSKKAMAEDRYVARRQQKCQDFLLEIKNSLDEPKLYHLLQNQINKNFMSKYIRNKYKQLPLKMTVYWMDIYMRPIFKAPSKFSSLRAKKKIVSDIRRLNQEKTSPVDLARLRENYKTLLKYYYKRSDGRGNIYWCHG